MELSTDADVIAASVLDPGVFGELFDRHAATLLRYVMRRIGPNEAGAVLGEVWRTVFERRASFDRSHENARPWLYGIATNLVARHLRGERRRHAAWQRLPLPAILDPSADVATAVDAAAELARVVQRIRALPAGERDALLLNVWEGLSYEDVAAALSIPIGTVRSRINRARRRLRELPARPGEQVVHPDVLRQQKEQLMATTSPAATSDPYEHRSRMYPRLAYRDELAALEYLTRVFGFVERREARLGSGAEDDHMLAWLEFGAGLVMISHVNVDVHQIHSPADLGATTTMINVEVDDIDQHYAPALAAGATVTMELCDAPYGARVYEATDPEGHRWHFHEVHDHVRARGGLVPPPVTPC